MRKVVAVITVLIVMFSLGCSCISLVEKEDFVDICDREEYVSNHPESRFCDNIINGEIIRGMESSEVTASWGLPNVYLVSEKNPEEYWVYYIQNNDTRAVFIYTLIFDEENQLTDWDIDMKRFTNVGYIYSPGSMKEPEVVKSRIGKH